MDVEQNKYFISAPISSHLLKANSSVIVMYEGRLKSSWTHLITPSRNFVEVR
jgi:hypothetical protein